MRALVIVAIVMVAVMMGLSLVAPAMAQHGGPDLPQKACDALAKIIVKRGSLPTPIQDIFFDHCFPPKP